MEGLAKPGTSLEHKFFGRERELSELSELIAQGQRIVTIVAPGGYGKSRLSGELLVQLADSFADGISEVRLAPVGDSGRIARTAAETLGLKVYHHAEALELLKDFLREKNLLLHFDNFEHLIEGAHILQELLEAAPGLNIVVTSREPLGLALEHVYRLAALPVLLNGSVALEPQLSTAASLFAHRAQLAAGEFIIDDETRAAVENICVQLEGVPLALELTAAWLGTYDLIRIESELREQLDVTARTAEVSERHRSVRASCDWSYQLLDENQQLVLRCIAVFKGSFSVAQAVRILPEQRLEECLRELVAKSWLYVEQTSQGLHFQMHDAAIREYAFQRLLNSDDYEVAVTAHCSLYVGLLEEYCSALESEGQLAAVQGLDLEIENIYEALDSALHRTNHDWVLSFAKYLQQYLLMVGSAGECLARYRELEEYCEPLKSPALCQATKLGLAAAALRLGTYGVARQYAESSLQAAKQLDDQRGRAAAEAVLGELDKLEGDHSAARFHYTNSLDLMQLSGDSSGVGQALHGLGRVDMTESNFAAARRLISESLEIRRKLGDMFGVAHCLNDLGNMAYREGDYAEAFSLQTESLEIRRGLGDKHGIAQSLNNLGNVEFFRCDYPAAWSLYSESLAIRRNIGNRFGIAASLNNLGNVEYCQGNYQDAWELHMHGLEIKREIGDRVGISFSLNNLGNIAIRQERYQDAAESLTEALEAALEVNSKECKLAPLAISSCLLANQGHYRVAGLLAAGAASQSRETGLAFDPMDGGRLSEALEIVRLHLSVDDQLEVKTAAEKLCLDELAELAMRELRQLLATS